jgi:hypothetical protein
VTFENRSGVFLVRYDSLAALSPESQTQLEAALRDASIVEPVGIVFVVGPSVQMVGHDVPDYWLGITTDPRVRIGAIAVVTPNPAVSVATRGFSAANILRNTTVAVKPFQDEAEALGWVKEQVSAAKRKGAPDRRA